MKGKSKACLAGRIAVELAVLAPLACSASPEAVLYKSLLARFSPLHLIPIAVPRGEEVGGVYGLPSMEYLADRKTCFPKLILPRSSPTVLPSVQIGNDVGAALTLGLTAADISAAGTHVQNVVITFQDAKVVAAPSMTIANAYRQESCPFLKGIIGSFRQGDRASTPANLVVGEVYVARRTITITYDNKAGVEAGLSRWRKALKLANLNAKADISGGSSFEIKVSSDDELPVAVRPAFTPDLVGERVLGEENQGDPLTTPLRWKAGDGSDANENIDYLASLISDAYDGH